MDLRTKTERLDGGRIEDVARAAALLRVGGTVAFATETVYGLGAHALDADAVERIFVAKGRPHWDPLIVHVADQAMLARVARLEGSALWMRGVGALMEAFWPGALTLLLPRAAGVPGVVTAGREMVGVRMPGHVGARRLIEMAGVPVAAPSANRFGHTSPTTAAHVLQDLDGRINAVLDGGAAGVGVESTVVEVEEDGGVLVYRPGGVTLGELEGVLGVGWVRRYVAAEPAGEPAGLPSPGVGIRHYAPRARVVLVEVPREDREPLELILERAVAEAVVEDGTGGLGVMLPEGWSGGGAGLVYAWGPWGDAEVLARRLFAGLRELDERGARVIVAPLPAGGGMGDAVRDRLEKAARLA